MPNNNRVDALLGKLRKRDTGGTGVDDKNFVQVFITLSTVTVTHNLGKKPAVTIIDSANDEVVGDVVHDSDNQLTVTFSSPFSGTIICN